MMDLNKDVESPCRKTSDWGFIGYLSDGTPIPIGTYSSYRDGVAHANSWLNSTSRAERWEGQPLYEEVNDAE